jgi:hypothetical protein
VAHEATASFDAARSIAHRPHEPSRAALPRDRPPHDAPCPAAHAAREDSLRMPIRRARATMRFVPRSGGSDPDDDPVQNSLQPVCFPVSSGLFPCLIRSLPVSIRSPGTSTPPSSDVEPTLLRRRSTRWRRRSTRSRSSSSVHDPALRHRHPRWSARELGLVDWTSRCDRRTSPASGRGPSLIGR